MVRRAKEPVGLDQAMTEARGFGAHYLLYTRFARADDRISNSDEWLDQEEISRGSASVALSYGAHSNQIGRASCRERV